MIAKPKRRRRRRRRREIIHGRTNCGHCTRFRPLIDFSVVKWADYEQTKPDLFNFYCKPCKRQRNRERRPSHPRPDQLQRTDPGIHGAFARMSLQDRQEWSWEGGVPLSRWNFADEDYDTTPVPQGCPNCWMRGGNVCLTCPDIELRHAATRKARKKALALAP